MKDSDTEKRLREVHGPDACYICGKPKTTKGNPHCSYPHGMLPATPVNPDRSEGVWTWEKP